MNTGVGKQKKVKSQSGVGLLEYSDDQNRDDHGKFSAGAIGSKEARDNQDTKPIRDLINRMKKKGHSDASIAKQAEMHYGKTVKKLTGEYKKYSGKYSKDDLDSNDRIKTLRASGYTGGVDLDKGKR